MPKKKSSSKGSLKQSKKDHKRKHRETLNYSIDDVLDKAVASINSYEYEMAQRYCKRALELDNDNIRALELTAQVLMEIGDLLGAQQCYGRCVELQPTSGHVKYLNLAQILHGQQSLQCYFKAIDIMRDQLTSQESKAAEKIDEEKTVADNSVAERDGTAAAAAHDDEVVPAVVTIKDLSTVYLSVAELFMTDLCDEENAEEECVKSIKRAIDIDKSNPEGYQLLADYYLIKGQLPDARREIKQGISLWLPQLMRLVGESDDVADDKSIDDPVDCLPISPEAQLKAAKTLIELEEYNDATDILELLLDQDDSAVEVWYLLGWLNYLQGDEYKSTAKHYLTKGFQAAEKSQSVDDGVLNHVKELLEELKDINLEDIEGEDADGGDLEGLYESLGNMEEMDES